MRIRRLLPALLVIAAASPGLPSPVLASPATSDGARQLEQSYADYLTRAVIDKGVVSVTPDGDDYVVAWDLEKGIVLLGADPGALKAARFSYRLTPTGDGAWRLAADGFPTPDDRRADRRRSDDRDVRIARLRPPGRLRPGAGRFSAREARRRRRSRQVQGRRLATDGRHRRSPRPASSARRAPRAPPTAPASTSHPSIRSLR